MVARKQYKIAVAGLSYAGKTCTLKRLLTGQFMPTEPTHGFDTEGFERSNVRFLAMDLGGQEVFIQTLWRSFMPQAECLVFVVDASDQGSFQKARDVLLFSISWNPKIKALMVLANKQDLPGASTIEETLDRLDLPTILAENSIQNFRIFGTSAKTGDGIEDAFSWLAKQLIKVESSSTANIHAVHVFNKVKQLSEFEQDKDIVNKLVSVYMSASGKTVNLAPDTIKKLTFAAEEAFKGKRGTVVIQDSSGQGYKIVSTTKDGLCNLLVTDTGDDDVTAEAIGNEILEYASLQATASEPLDEKDISYIIHPFLLKKAGKEPEPPGKEEEEEPKVPARKTVLETVNEMDRQYTQRGYEVEGSDFFTKMSVMDRIRAIEKRKNTR